MTVHIRSATLHDAALLARLAAATFRETFEADNTPEDMARYVDAAFNPEQQAAEIADPRSIVLLAQHGTVAGAQLVGYAHLSDGRVPPAVRGPRPLELKRLYVTRAFHGHGVAQALMNAVMDAARGRGAQTLWLGVWERNARAMRFYGKHGFVRVGEHTFMLGSDAQSDWLLARPLGAVGSTRAIDE